MFRMCGVVCCDVAMMFRTCGSMWRCGTYDVPCVWRVVAMCSDVAHIGTYWNIGGTLAHFGGSGCGVWACTEGVVIF